MSRRNMNKRIDHDLYSLRPNYDPLQQHPMVNDDLPNRIICGGVTIKADVKRLTETGVEFVDGTKIDDVDVVVSATGYSFGFPFIDKKVIDVQDNEINLYLNTFLPDLQHQTMAIIGCVQGFGSITPATEMQSRTACQIFKGKSSLPSQSEMWRDIRMKRARNERRYVKSRRHTIQVEVLEFMDSLARICGCAPDYWHLWTTDPVLAYTTIFGPMTPYQLRLYGPNKWPGAREAIMNQWKRVAKPLKTRPLPERELLSKTVFSMMVNMFFCFLMLFSLFL